MDRALDCGWKHTCGLQALSRVLGHHGHWRSECPKCDVEQLNGTELGQGDHLWRLVKYTECGTWECEFTGVNRWNGLMKGCGACYTMPPPVVIALDIIYLTH